MGQVDTVTKAYVQNNVVFADIFNQFIYDGQQVIQPDCLSELDTTALGRGQRGKMLQKNRDVLSRWSSISGLTHGMLRRSYASFTIATMNMSCAWQRATSSTWWIPPT